MDYVFIRIGICTRSVCYIDQYCYASSYLGRDIDNSSAYFAMDSGTRLVATLAFGLLGGILILAFASVDEILHVQDFLRNMAK